MRIDKKETLTESFNRFLKENDDNKIDFHKMSDEEISNLYADLVKKMDEHKWYPEFKSLPEIEAELESRNIDPISFYPEDRIYESFDQVQYWGSKNQYGYSVRQLKIDYGNKTYAVGSFKQSVDKKVTNKAISEKIEELKALGFKEETKESLTEEDKYVVYQRGGMLGDQHDLEDKVFGSKEEAQAALKSWKDSYGKNKSYYKPEGSVSKYKGKTPRQQKEEYRNSLNEDDNEECVDIDAYIGHYEYPPEIEPEEEFRNGGDSSYFTVVKNEREAEKFNYHSDYWGSEDEYQQQNVELVSSLESDIENGTKFCMYDGDNKFVFTITGIAIDRQYNSISHTKILINPETPMVECGELTEGYENKKERKIPTGLTDDKSKDVINAVVGQLSDGMWENSPGMERYWKFTSGADDNGNIIVYDGYVSVDEYAGMNRYGGKKYNTKWIYSAFSKMDDDAVKRYFAAKIKQIVKEEGLEWNRNNTQPCEYLDYHSGVTVRDAYKVYDRLLGRIDRIKDEETPVNEAIEPKYFKSNPNYNKGLKDIKHYSGSYDYLFGGKINTECYGHPIIIQYFYYEHPWPPVSDNLVVNVMSDMSSGFDPDFIHDAICSEFRRIAYEGKLTQKEVKDKILGIVSSLDKK